MVNHREKVGYDGVILQLDAHQQACPKQQVVAASILPISPSHDSCSLTPAPFVAYCGIFTIRPLLSDMYAAS